MRYLKGNLLEAQAHALVNTVNTVGVMGKGIALQFKESFPENYKAYVAACKNKDLQPGKMLVFQENGYLIINFPTKTDWRFKSEYAYIESGLDELARTIEKYKIESIAIPPLGCGNGGLKWEIVKAMIASKLSHLSHVDVQVFEPNEEVKEILKNQKTTKEVELTPTTAMLLYTLFYYESLGESISLFVANKLAYFLQRLGETSFNQLKFESHYYGPFSIGVERMLHQLNGKYLKGLEQRNAKAFEPLELQYNRMQEVSDFVRTKLSAPQKARLSKLVKLVDGFQTTLSLELLATVDFVRKDKPGIDQAELVKTIYSWSERKRNLFQERYIKIAAEHLENSGILG